MLKIDSDLEEVSVVVKPSTSFTKPFQFYTSIFLFSFLLFSILLNIFSLLFAKFTTFSFLNGGCVALLSYNVLICGRDLKRNLKERKEMKQNGQEFCNVCKGASTVSIITTYRASLGNKIKKARNWEICKKCNGTGKIDWVQKVIHLEEKF